MSRCYICDCELSDNEIQFDEDMKTEPCKTCWDVIMDTAYSSGFEPGGTPEVGEMLEEEIDDELGVA